jgi:4-hydroxy-3-polyprenylbenzoate decarboxylase
LAVEKKCVVSVVSAIVVFLALNSFCLSEEELKFTGPYDTLRDYVAALEARGRLMRVEEIDQDKYEGTALAYRIIDKMGYHGAPGLLFERVKINGQWMEGPVVANIYGGWDTEAMVYGVEKITEDQGAMYRATTDKLASLVDDGGQWKKIKPIAVDKSTAPCKEVILTGDAVDLYTFPWLKSNPGDASQYINSGSIITEDPELGRNVGTYRCQVKAKNKIGVNFERAQHGWQFLMRAKRRGEPVMKAAVALGVDPIIFGMSASKVAALGEDELAFAGGFKGKPVELVKCETSDILVPAQAEMIIEGEIPTGEMEEEGPYGELYGYMGHKKPRNFFMNVKAITHRKKPLFVNSFAGVTKLQPVMPTEVNTYLKFKKAFPSLVALYSPPEARTMTVVSISKRFPGDGMAAGQLAAVTSFLSKVIIVVDKDIDVTNMSQVLHAVATRWQPDPASLIISQTRSMPLDPSAPKWGMTSKIIIDATQQLPQEGGPKSWPPVSRVLVQEQAPEAFELVDKKWPEYLKGLKKRGD